MTREEREADREKRDREMREERREAARIRDDRFAEVSRFASCNVFGPIADVTRWTDKEVKKDDSMIDLLLDLDHLPHIHPVLDLDEVPLLTIIIIIVIMMIRLHHHHRLVNHHHLWTLLRKYGILLIPRIDLFSSVRLQPG